MRFFCLSVSCFLWLSTELYLYLLAGVVNSFLVGVVVVVVVVVSSLLLWWGLRVCR